MKVWQPSLLALALAAAFPAHAQSTADLMKEFEALKARVADLEKQLKDAQAAKPAAGQWGMTPEQARDLNRVTVKTEAIEDNLEMQGFKGLTITGYIEPTFIYNQRQDRAGFQFLNSQSDGYFYDTSFMGAASIDFTKETDQKKRSNLRTKLN